MGIRNVLTFKMALTDPESLQTSVVFQICTQISDFFRSVHKRVCFSDLYTDFSFFRFIHRLVCFSDLYTDLCVFQIYTQTCVFFRFIHRLVFVSHLYKFKY
jgi:hypothetical protein